jgi:HEAT repeat protein
MRKEQAMRKAVWLAVVFSCLTSTTWAGDVDALVKQLKDPSADVRRAAAKSLGEMGADAMPAVPALIKALKDDKDMFVRRFSAQSLGELGPDAKSAIKELTNAMKDPKKEVAEAATSALSKMGDEGVPALVDTIKDKKKDLKVRQMAIQSLGTMSKDTPKAAVTALADALKDADLRVTAVGALGDLGPNASSAVEAIQSVLKDNKDRTFRQAANTALKKIGKK